MPPLTTVPHDPDGVPAEGLGRVEWVLVGLAVAAGIVLRIVTLSDLWLDEALSVNIAGLDYDQIIGALRHDGHPPLYYFLLHAWMDVFGDGDIAVHALSGIFSVLMIPVVGVMAARRRGWVAGAMAIAVVSVLPYATRYATEARMYSLVMLLAALGWYLIDTLLDDEAGWPTTIAVAVVAGLLLYTHYWSIWLIGVAGLALLLCAWRTGNPARRRGAWRGAGALVVGGLTFLPWLPVMIDQLAHTGTPWGAPQRPSMSVAIALVDFAGGNVVTEATLGAIVLTVLVLLALMARPAPPDRVTIQLRTVPGVRPGLVVAAGALAVGMSVAWLTGATFASRYAAFAVPVLVVAAGLGLVTMPSRSIRMILTAATLAVLGGAALVAAADQRTQGGEAAAAVNERAEPGDIVVVCPDQLGPAFSRSLDADVVVVTHPSLDGPELVDWRDYGERNAQGDPAAVAAEVLERAGDSTVWLVWSSGYSTYDSQCENLREALGSVRPVETVVVARPGEVFEPMWLERFAAP